MYTNYELIRLWKCLTNLRNINTNSSIFQTRLMYFLKTVLNASKVTFILECI